VITNVHLNFHPAANVLLAGGCAMTPSLHSASDAPLPKRKGRWLAYVTLGLTVLVLALIILGPLVPRSWGGQVAAAAGFGSFDGY
jgi:hypothetical protein